MNARRFGSENEITPPCSFEDKNSAPQMMHDDRNYKDLKLWQYDVIMLSFFGLFNDTVSSSDYIASNDRTVKPFKLSGYYTYCQV
jgi:hypothetical protein